MPRETHHEEGRSHISNTSHRERGPQSEMRDSRIVRDTGVRERSGGGSELARAEDTQDAMSEVHQHRVNARGKRKARAKLEQVEVCRSVIARNLSDRRTDT